MKTTTPARTLLAVLVSIGLLGSIGGQPASAALIERDSFILSGPTVAAGGTGFLQYVLPGPTSGIDIRWGNGRNGDQHLEIEGTIWRDDDGSSVARVGLWYLDRRGNIMDTDGMNFLTFGGSSLGWYVYEFDFETTNPRVFGVVICVGDGTRWQDCDRARRGIA